MTVMSQIRYVEVSVGFRKEKVGRFTMMRAGVVGMVG